MTKPSKPTPAISQDNELDLDALDQVVGGGSSTLGNIIAAPSNFVGGVIGGTLFGPTATDGQMGFFGDKSQTGFGLGAEVGMMVNMGIAGSGNLGNLASNAAGLADSAIGAIGSAASSIGSSLNSYFNPEPGHGAPGDTYVPATANADGSINPGHFEAPTTPTGQDAASHDGQDAASHDGQDAANHDGQDAAANHDGQDAANHDGQDAAANHDGQDTTANHDGQDAAANHDGQDTTASHDGQDGGSYTEAGSSHDGGGGYDDGGGGGGGGFDGGGGGDFA